MKAARFGLLLLVLVATGCGHKVTEADLTGTWRVDAASVPNAPTASMAKNTTLSLTPDHKFVMAPTDQIQIKGAWGLTEQQVLLTPMTLAVTSPVEPAKRLEIPVDQAVEAMKAMPGAVGQNTDALAKPLSLKVESDGTSMTTPDNVVLKKAS